MQPISASIPASTHIPPTTLQPLLWQRAAFQRDSRFYVIELSQDLWGDWMITRTFGSRLTRQRRELNERWRDFTSALERYQTLSGYRVRKRRYTQVV